MIRINLLPVRQAKRREYGKQQLVVGAFVILLELVALFIVYTHMASQLSDVQDRVAAVQADVRQQQEQNRELAQLREQKAALQATANVLADLEANRAGPVQVLDELKRILNPPMDELDRVTQQSAQWDTTWDPTSLWITSFSESGRALQLSGVAMSNDDIAEFNSRLLLSPYFSDVRVLSVTAGNTTGLGRTYTFRIDARVNYVLADSQG